MELLAKGGRETKQLMLRAGLALALSVAGYVISHIRSRRAAAGCRRRLPSASGGSLHLQLLGFFLFDMFYDRVCVRGFFDFSAILENSDEDQSGGEQFVEHKDELHFMKQEGNSPILSGNTVTLLPASDDNPSQTSKNLENEDGYLLPEFNELVSEEFKMTAQESDPQISHVSASPMIENDDKPETEEEITNLRNLVESLQEREMNLEIQLLEYYGLKEQDAVVKELESRLQISTMEAKLFSLKIESLQAENQRLEAQLSDHSRVVTELVSTKENIEVLKKKLSSSDGDQVEKMIALQGTNAVLEDDGEHAEDEYVERSLKKLRDLGLEAMNLRTENSNLSQANLELSKRLESIQSAGSTITDTSKVNDALEEVDRLRKRNDELSKELERSQMDHCADVEELVYLRWVNACLRYELRNYQPTRCKTVAKDLSKTLSPKSEEEVKELILKYAKSGHNEKIVMDFDSDYCSSSLESSSPTENGEPDDSSTNTKSNSGSSKAKFFGKLKKLVLGKETHGKRVSSSAASPTNHLNLGRRASVSNSSVDDVIMGGRRSCDSVGSLIAMDHAPLDHTKIDDEISSEDQNKTSWCETSLDKQKLKMSSAEEEGGARAARCKSDLGSSVAYKRFVLGERSSLSEQEDGHEHLDPPEKLEMKKFADILKGNRQCLRTHQRSASYNA